MSAGNKLALAILNIMREWREPSAEMRDFFAEIRGEILRYCPEINTDLVLYGEPSIVYMEKGAIRAYKVDKPDGSFNWTPSRQRASVMSAYDAEQLVDALRFNNPTNGITYGREEADAKSQ